VNAFGAKAMRRLACSFSALNNYQTGPYYPDVRNDDVFDVAKVMVRAEWDGIGDLNYADVDVEDLESTSKILRSR
jgi:hypothetical protein